MFLRILVCATVSALALTSCSTPYKKKDEQQRKERSGEQIKDQSEDTSFQAFLGRLRAAANRKDRVALASLMVPGDFGYRWDPAPAGETPFDYWDQHNLWGELQTVLRSQFQPQDNYMKAPPEAVTNQFFSGFRAGIRMQKGTYRFAYFVGPEEPGQ